MTMSNADICLEYRQAKDKDAQIGILADLNQCSRETIREILEKGGEQIDTPSNDLDALRERVRRTLAALDKLESVKEQPVKAKPVKAATPAPKKSGVTLSKADATLLSEFMEASVCQHVVNQLATDEPRECLLQLHKLTGLYKRLVEVLE